MHKFESFFKIFLGSTPSSVYIAYKLYYTYTYRPAYYFIMIIIHEYTLTSLQIKKKYMDLKTKYSVDFAVRFVNITELYATVY